MRVAGTCARRAAVIAMAVGTATTLGATSQAQAAALRVVPRVHARVVKPPARRIPAKTLPKPKPKSATATTNPPGYGYPPPVTFPPGYVNAPKVKTPRKLAPTTKRKTTPTRRH